MTDKNYHAPAGGDLFAPSALCGITANDEPDHTLRVHQGSTEVTCVNCRTLLMEASK